MENGIITVKFGGTSLADADNIQRAADIVRSDPRRRVVVVSAPGKRGKDDIKVTDLLYACCEHAEAGRDFMPALEAVKARFSEILAGLNLSFPLEEEMRAIAEAVARGAGRDYVASRGEYLNAKIVAALLGFTFADAAENIFFTAEGRLDEAKTYATLAGTLSGTAGTVLPGFYGSDPAGRVKTFSRGGSDVSGAIAARAAGAAVYENWTDVSGMLFADPRIVPHPPVIGYITYRELRELSYMGASVLHEDAVFPVRQAGIPIRIRNTFRPQDEGTRIVADLPGDILRRTVTGIAGRKGFTSILVERSMMNGEVGFGVRLLKIFSDHGIPFEHCPTGIDTVSVVVNSEHFDADEEDILREINEQLTPDYMAVHKHLAMIAVVGQGLVTAKGYASRIFSALAGEGIAIRMIDAGSSEMNVIVSVDEENYEAALRALAREFA